MPVYRAPMRSRDDTVPDGVGVERALEIGACGFGGRLVVAPGSLGEAVAALAAEHGDPVARRLERFARVADGAYVWTRDIDGMPRLGRIRGPWRYDGSPAAHAVDLVHVRPCEWLPAPVADAQVPPAVQLTFRRGGRNWQQTHDDAVSAQTAAVWRAMHEGPDAAASDPSAAL